MSFLPLLKPVMLFGALLAGIPIIIHLLNRSRYRVEPYGAMMFLRSAVRVRSQTLKLQQLLLLLLRILFFILLAMALARPVTTSMHGGSQLEPTTHVVILDGSYSMQQGHGGETAFSKAKRSALALVDQMAAYDNMMIVWGGRKPRPLFPTPSFDRAFLRQTIDSLKPGSESINVTAALSQALWTLEQSTLPRRRVYLLTDRQANGWALDRNLDWQRLIRHRELLKVPPLTYVLGQGVEGRVENLSIRSLSSRSPVIDVFRQTTFVVEVANHARRRLPVRVSLSVDGGTPQEERLNISAGVHSVHFDHQFSEPGSHYVTASLGDDDLNIDNTLTRAVEVLATIPVLLVEGRSSTTPFGADGGFLREALLAAGMAGEAGLFSVKVVNQADMDRLDVPELRRFGCVILANVQTFSQTFVFALERYVEQGGGVFVALGRDVLPMEYAKLFKDGRGLLPGRLQEIRKHEENFFQPVFPAGAGTFVLDIFDLSRARALGDVKVASYWRCEPSDDAVILARFDSDPFLLYRPFGRGQVLLWTTAADQSWSNFPFTEDYLPLVQNVVVSLSAGVSASVHLVQGETLVYSTREPLVAAGSGGEGAGANHDAPCRVTLPDGTEHPVDVAVAGDEWVARWTDTVQPGLYTVHAGDQSPRYFSVQLDPAEADLRPLSGAEGTIAKARVDGRFVDSFRDLQARLADERGVREWWKPIVLTILVLLCVELILGWRFSG